MGVRHLDQQSSVFDFLRNPAAWGPSWAQGTETIEVVDTFGARIFLSRTHALKVKRAVSAAYLDYSKLAARHRSCLREIDLNQPHAPDIYLKLIAINRDRDGHLSLDGPGETIEWAVLMRRFAEDDILSSPAARARFDDRFTAKLADMAYSLHESAARLADAADTLPQTVEGVLANLRRLSPVALLPLIDTLAAGFAAALAATADLRASRGAHGFIRRCHGDLHLGNVIAWKGEPVPFDALEFDEGLATIDVLYDLAFLLMDLKRRDLTRAANQVLNRYLWRGGDLEGLKGLALLPLFFSLRAAVRAMVALDRGRIGLSDAHTSLGHVSETLSLAASAILPPPPRLIAIGGLSGTGKSTLGAALAPEIPPVPGALHLRSDMERKRLAGVEAEARLPPESYSAQASGAVYRRLLQRAETALQAGHSVIVDAVFAKPDERRAMAMLAARLGVSFQGLWLEAPLCIMRSRVADRTGDASDATPDIVMRQMAYRLGDIAWTKIAAGSEAEATLESARQALDGRP